MIAKIFSIIRGSVHDGYGLRTVLYFKGCNLRCAWCHNPEGFKFTGEVLYYPDKCIGCATCETVCPQKCCRVANGRAVLDRSACISCFRCADSCPAQALRRDCFECDLSALEKEIFRDQEFYARTGGGVTLSGGECLLQPEFAGALLADCRREGIHSIVESALYIEWETIEKYALSADCIMTDIKCMDASVHEKMTGVRNEKILSNIRRLSAEHADVWVRIPLIPGVNDGEKNLALAAEFLNGCGAGVRRLEILQYNDLAASKYASLGIQPGFAGQRQSAEEMLRVRRFFRRALRKDICVIE